VALAGGDTAVTARTSGQAPGLVEQTRLDELVPLGGLGVGGDDRVIE